MNDEIKEILDNTLEYLEGIDETRNTKILTTNETNILLDYITNLQQKIKHYEETTTFGDYVKEVNLLVDYKSRIDKAIEYFEYQLSQLDFEKDTMAKMLCAMALVILRGDDK